MEKYTFEYALNIVKNFDGWLSKEQAELIYDLVKSVPKDGSIVEIGSWAGKSMTVIVTATLEVKNNAEIYSIDPYLTSKDESNNMYEKFVSNMKQIGYWDKIIQIKEKSHEFGINWKKPISFIFIDGFHRYDVVKQDFELYFKHLLQNGICILHDVVSWYGPTKLSIELLENRDDIEVIDLVGSALALRKVELLTNEMKLKNMKIKEHLVDVINTQELKI